MLGQGQLKDDAVEFSVLIKLIDFRFKLLLGDVFGKLDRLCEYTHCLAPSADATEIR